MSRHSKIFPDKISINLRMSEGLAGTITSNMWILNVYHEQFNIRISYYNKALLSCL